MLQLSFHITQGENNMATVKFIRTSENAIPPARATEGSLGWDLYMQNDKDRIIPSNRVLIVDTGIAIELPHEDGKVWEAQIRPRSGMAARLWITVLNTPGTIDEDYRGTIKVILINFGTDDIKLRKGSRIAQMVVTCHDVVEFEEVDELMDTERGDGGLGSTDAPNEQHEQKEDA